MQIRRSFASRTSFIKYTVAAAITLAATFGLVASALADELTLEEAIRLAITNHPKVEAARKAVAAAERSLQKASAPFSFHLSTSASPYKKSMTTDTPSSDVSLTGSIASANGTSLSASLDQKWSGQKQGAASLSLAGSVGLDPASLFYSSGRLSLETARYQVEKAGLDLQQTERSVALDALAEFWQLELDAQRLTISRESLAEKQAFYQAALKREAAGAATHLDVLSAQIDLRQAEVSAETSEAGYHSRLEAFAADLGWTGDTSKLSLVSPGGAVVDQLADTVEVAPLTEAAVANSSTVRDSEENLRMARLRLNGSELSKFPDVTLSASYIIPDVSNPSGTDPKWDIHLRATLPLLDGGTRRLTAEERRLSVDEAEETVSASKEAALDALESKHRAWEQACVAVEIAEMKLEKAELEENTLSEKFRLGTVSNSSLSAANRASRAAQIDLQAAINQRYLAELGIKLISGEELTVYDKPLLN